MKNYKKLILNKLIDKYEKSKLYKTDSLNNIYFKFNEKTLPEYFDELDSRKKMEIDAVCEELEKYSFINLYRGSGFDNHIIKKVSLNILNTEDIYVYLGRLPKKGSENKLIELLEEYKSNIECLENFTKFVLESFSINKSIKKYMDIEKLGECKDIIVGIYSVMKQKEEILRRSFSIKLYGDSKRYEELENKVFKIITDFSTEKSQFDYNIMKNSTYVYFRGNISLNIDGNEMQLSNLSNGIGISSKDIDKLSNIVIKSKKLVTIENLTSFNNLKGEDTAIYLGGYHNKVREDLLKKIYENNRFIEYYHCGDIDVGGFKILSNLKRKTGIPFKALNMNIDTLKEYIGYGKRLSSNDIKELKRMLEVQEYKEHYNLFEFMLEHNKKLEQEIIF